MPLSSQLAVTVWDLSPTGSTGFGIATGEEYAEAEEADGHAIPFGGTTISLFDDDNTLRKGRQRCYLHRHRVADGLSGSTTPHAKPASRRRGSDGWAQQQQKQQQQHKQDGTAAAAVGSVVDDRTAEMERLEALMKKHEMGEIPENKWLDQLVFRKIEKLERAAPRNAHHVTSTLPKTSDDATSARTNGHSTNKGHDDATTTTINTNTDINAAKNPNTNTETDTNTNNYPIDDGRYFLFLEFPRFDHPIVFTDFEYPAPPISSLLPHPHTASSSSDIRLKPPPEIQIQPGPGLGGVGHDGHDEPSAGRLIRIFDPEAGVKDNPAESKHRRLVRHHRTGVLDRDLKPNAIIRDELNVRYELIPSHVIMMI